MIELKGKVEILKEGKTKKGNDWKLFKITVGVRSFTCFGNPVIKCDPGYYTVIFDVNRDGRLFVVDLRHDV